MAHHLCIRISFDRIIGNKCVSDPPQESKYLVYSANDTTLNIFLSENYENWKKIEV